MYTAPWEERSEQQIYEADLEARSELMYRLRDNAEKFVCDEIADPQGILAKVLEIIAREERNWEQRRSNGNQLTYVQQKAHTFTEIMDMLGKEIPEMKEI